MESEDFVKFAINFTENLKDKWWSLSFDERKGGEQTLFNGEFYIDNSAKVKIPQFSTIYGFGTIKKDLSFDEKSLLEELPATAAGSISLTS